MLLRVHAEIKLADRIIRLQSRSHPQMRDRFFDSSLLGENRTHIIFSDEVGRRNRKRVRPQSEVVAPIGNLNAGDRRQGYDNAYADRS